MDRIIANIIIGVLLVSFPIFVVWWTYRFEKNRLGSEVAKRLFPQRLTVFAISVGFLILLRSLEEIFAELFVVFGVAIFIVWTARILLNQPVKREALVDFSEVRSINRSGVIVFGVIGFAFLILSLFIVEHRKNFLIAGAMLSMLAIYLAVYMQKAQYFITERGVFQGFDEIEWKQIESYVWAKSHEEKTILVFQTKGWLPSFLSYREMTIPTTYKDRVDQLFCKYVNPLQVQSG